MFAITELTEADRAEWDGYVRRSSQGLPQHLSGWRDVLAGGAYETHFLMARDGGRVVGLLPLFFIRSRFVGNTATTMPGALCADGDEVAKALLARAAEMSQQARLPRLVLHDTRTAWQGLETWSEHVHWVVDVTPGVGALWERLDRNIRRQIRMAQRNGLAVEIDRTGEGSKAFYDVYSRYAHRSGTPLFGRAFLQRVIASFPGGFDIALVRRGNDVLGAFFQMEVGAGVFGLWGATLGQYRELRPGYLAYWELIRYAAENGYRFLDMGRSPAGSTASSFKGQWGGVSWPVHQQAIALSRPSRPQERTPHVGVAQRVRSDRSMQMLMRLWPHLPLQVANWVGPMLRRHVPFG